MTREEWLERWEYLGLCMTGEPMTDALVSAAIAPHFMVRQDFIRGVVVSYRATAGSPTFTVAAHEWLPEYVVEHGDRIIARRKTPTAALRALVREADKVAR